MASSSGQGPKTIFPHGANPIPLTGEPDGLPPGRLHSAAPAASARPEAPVWMPGQVIVYLCRHGWPDLTRKDIPYHIPPGPDLTERGRCEAAELGEYLRGAGIVHVQASPLVRAWDTARIAARAAGLEVVLNHDLAEWRKDEFEPAVQSRMVRAYEQAAELSARCGPVALVSHGGPVHTLLKRLGLPGEVAERCRIYDSRNLIPTAGAWLVHQGCGIPRLAFVPSTVPAPAV